MNKEKSRSLSLSVVLSILFVLVLLYSVLRIEKEGDVRNEIFHVTGIVLYSDEEFTAIGTDDEKVYIFDKDEIDEKTGTGVKIDYKEDKKESSKNDNGKKESSVLKVDPPKNSGVITDNKVIDYTVVEDSKIPDSWLDGGLFSVYYTKAYEKLKTLSLDEKIGQTLIVRYPLSGADAIINDYHIGGYVFFERDFKGKSKNDVVNMINSAQRVSKIPLLTAIDEEGGKVSRLSSNSSLTKVPFESPQALYARGGFEEIKTDVRTKSAVLKGLGLNLNFAPVVDVSTDPNNYIYSRTLGQGTELTSTYAKSVIMASKGLGVSYTLKHFPGYGSNLDTHSGSSVSKKSYEKLLSEDIPPFKEGINSGAEAVMVSHNIVECIDANNESSISSKVHSLLRNDLKFTGVIITDDISMGAMKNVDDVGRKALAAGNDLIITSDVATTFDQIKRSIKNGSVKLDVLDRNVFRILAWKYYKGLL